MRNTTTTSPTLPATQSDPFIRFLITLNKVEASGETNPPPGDNGTAIGPFQIHHAYWQDAVQTQPELLEPPGYQACTNWDYAGQIVKAYMLRYVPLAVASNNLETLARTHNGGPEGAQKDSTLIFWLKFQNQLN
jgi:hypothetical protein